MPFLHRAMAEPVAVRERPSCKTCQTCGHTTNEEIFMKRNLLIAAAVAAAFAIPLSAQAAEKQSGSAAGSGSANGSTKY